MELDPLVTAIQFSVEQLAEMLPGNDDQRASGSKGTVDRCEGAIARSEVAVT